jgi:hypothetical protein
MQGGDSSRLFDWDALSPVPEANGRVERRGRDTIAKGAASEVAAIGRLLALGHRVAIPFVDDHGVDLVVNYRVVVQVKGREAQQVAGMTYNFSLKRLQQPELRRHLDVFLFHAQDIDVWWVVPRAALDELGVVSNVCLGTTYASRFRDLDRFREAWEFFDATRI